MGAESREELLNGQVKQLNFKVDSRLFQTKGVTWRETENQSRRRKVHLQRFSEKAKELKLLAAREKMKGFEDKSNLDEESAFDR